MCGLSPKPSQTTFFTKHSTALHYYNYYKAKTLLPPLLSIIPFHFNNTCLTHFIKHLVYTNSYPCPSQQDSIFQTQTGGATPKPSTTATTPPSSTSSKPSRYFSGEDNIMNNRNEKQSTNNWTRAAAAAGIRRISLDLPAMRSQHHRHAAADQKQTLKDKKYKQPSSPGGRLASFLNSLFSQSKKKPKSNAAATDHELDDSSGGGRRKRRSSISHFGSTNYTDHNISKSSGFRTPPAKTPTKTADLRSLSDYKEAAASMSLPNKYSNSDREKLRFRDELLSEKNYEKFDQYYSHSDRKEHKAVFEDEDDGAESDSSSDLFELQNYDLGCYASGLPVYETTHIDSVKRGAPISVNGS